MAVTDVLTLDEFVDLYKILEMPASASEAEIRERVNKLYLEAQRNLDHHNFRKRFYYQQLYEVHLPQAHQLLLNAPQRAEYDRYLDCFNKGLPFPADATGTNSSPSVGDLGRSEQIETDMLPSAVPVAETPKPATTSFDFDSATPSPTAPARPAAPASRPTRAVAPSPEGTASDATASIAAQVAKRKAQVAMDATEVERRRDYKRRELIKGELVAVGLAWGWGAGMACLLVVAAAVYFALARMNMKMSSADVLISSFVIGAVSGSLVGRYALRETRRRIIVVLSKMPYDELLRRCAK